MASVTVGESSTSIAISKSITPRYATSYTQSSTVAGAVERRDSGIGDIGGLRCNREMGGPTKKGVPSKRVG